MMSIRASDTAKAVNLLIALSNNDQQALLDVIQDYFSSPGDQEGDELDTEEGLEVTDVDADEQCHSEGKRSCLLKNLKNLNPCIAKSNTTPVYEYESMQSLVIHCMTVEMKVIQKKRMCW